MKPQRQSTRKGLIDAEEMEGEKKEKGKDGGTGGQRRKRDRVKETRKEEETAAGWRED